MSILLDKSSGLCIMPPGLDTAVVAVSWNGPLGDERQFISQGFSV